MQGTPRLGDRPHVVVIGAGFGGLAVARSLAGQPVRVTVVDRNNFHTFLPLLYQVATAGLNAADIAHPVRAIFHGTESVGAHLGAVTGVDWDAQQVEFADQEPLAFDHLVVAAGSGTNYFGVPGAAEHALPLYTLTDSVSLRNQVLGAFEAADRDPATIEDGALTFVIVGGGPTGVETAGALAELFDKVLRRDFPATPVNRARVVLVEMGDTLLAPFQGRSQHHAINALRHRGVEVRLATRVESVAADHVVLAGGEVVPTQTLIWAAGVRANPLVDSLAVEQGPGGRIVVDEDLSIPGKRGGWAVGDIAHMIPSVGANAGSPTPQLAPAAMQSGQLVAANIMATIAGRATVPFCYRNKGTMATIGRRSAVAEIPHFPPLTGSVAWASWLALHLWMLIGFRNRVSVLLNWAWNYLTWDRGPRIIMPTPRTGSPPAPEADR